ncbi:MAG: polyprenyl synthetase family protein [Azospirillaceae bacterium]
MTVTGSDDIAERMGEAAERVGEALDYLLPEPRDDEARLFEAMRYASLGGGKRLRPFLVLSSCGLFGVSESCALRVAAAVECVHCYSLVHDDLPAMDDDDLRRGKPTAHRAYDEATAILAGDALLTLAFEILSHTDTHADPLVRSNLVFRLARAVGGHGMVGGQMMDMLAARADFDIGQITRLQRLKTGELFAFACESGAIMGRVDSARRHALHAYAHDLGLAFQIADDLLDALGREEDVGKAVGKDADQGKATFVSILGIDRARDQARMLADQAIAHLELFEERAEPLRGVARFVVERRA